MYVVIVLGYSMNDKEFEILNHSDFLYVFTIRMMSSYTILLGVRCSDSLLNFISLRFVAIESDVDHTFKYILMVKIFNEHATKVDI